MTTRMTDDQFFAGVEELEVRGELEAEFFAVDTYGRRRMGDPTYAALFHHKLTVALEAAGMAPEPTADPLRQPPSESARKAWEEAYFKTDEHGVRLVSKDPAYKREMEARRDALFGTEPSQPNGEPYIAGLRSRIEVD